MLTESNSELPIGNGNESLDQGAPRVESFDAAVADTKKSLEGELNQQKRKRGRPKKIPSTDAGPSAPSHDIPTVTAQVEAVPQMDFKPFLNQSMKMPFNLWAKKANCAALKVTDSELETPIFYADQMLNYYGPRLETMDPGKTAMVMFSISILMLIAEKSSQIELTEAPQQTVATQENVAPVTTETAKTPSTTVPEGGSLYNPSMGRS